MHAPTGAARWFKQLATDFQVSPETAVQVLDIADSSSSEVYRQWIRMTKPTHPVLADSKREVLQQLNVTTGWPVAIVVGCDGDVKYKKVGEMDQAGYREVKALVEVLLAGPDCKRD